MLATLAGAANGRRPLAARGLAGISLELSVLEPLEQGDFFVPNLGQKMYVPDKILCCLNIAIQEFTWQKNLVKIALELSLLWPILQGDFFVPNLGQKMYVPDKIFCCLNIAVNSVLLNLVNSVFCWT